MGDQLLNLLSQYVSRINAQTLLSRSMSRVPGADSSTAVDARNLPMVLQRLRLSAPLFISPDRREDFISHLESFQSNSGESQAAAPESESIQVDSEEDIVVARTRARLVCEEMGAGRVSAHKVATVVSELARNIVAYTPGGYVELIPAYSPPTLTIRAVDRGQGIEGLNGIMGGDYRSKTGLGLGLLGSKRLAEDFQVKTGPTGTTITARMRV